MSYSELIKNFGRIRDYMREFYVCGFKSREEYDRKSARSYDDERRRIESWLGDYMGFVKTAGGKNVFLAIGNKVYSHGLVDNAAKDVLTLDGGETITLIKFNLYGNMQLDMLNKWKDEEFQNMQYKLIVCSSTGGENSGIVRFYNVDTNGKLTLYKEFKGLGEKIVDVTYRERRG